MKTCQFSNDHNQHPICMSCKKNKHKNKPNPRGGTANPKKIYILKIYILKNHYFKGKDGGQLLFKFLHVEPFPKHITQTIRPFSYHATKRTPGQTKYTKIRKPLKKTQKKNHLVHLTLVHLTRRKTQR